MKALLYKEFKLAMHPICYVFIASFPLMILIPSYPVAIGFIYVLTCYPVLFLGANKGQQSNDLLFSTLLPVRKKDIVLARIFTVIIMQIAFILITSALLPIALFIQNAIKEGASANATNDKMTIPGMPLESFAAMLGFVIIGYAVADLIFFPIYYKHGKSIVMSTLFTILGFVVYIGVVTIGLPYVPGIDTLLARLIDIHDLFWVQFVILGVGILISFLIHWLTYKISAKRLEQVDF